MFIEAHRGCLLLTTADWEAQCRLDLLAAFYRHTRWWLGSRITLQLAYESEPRRRRHAGLRRSAGVSGTSLFRQHSVLWCQSGEEVMSLCLSHIMTAFVFDGHSSQRWKFYDCFVLEKQLFWNKLP